MAKKVFAELDRVEQKTQSVKAIEDLYRPEIEVELRRAKVKLRSPLVSDLVAIARNKDGDVASTNALLSRLVTQWTEGGDSRDYATLIDIQELPVRDWYKLTDALKPLLEPADHEIETVPEGTVIRFREREGTVTIALKTVTFGAIERGDNLDAASELKATIDWIYSLTVGWDFTPLGQPIDRALFDKLEVRYSRVFQDWANAIVEHKEDATTRELEDYSTELTFGDGLTLVFREPTAKDLEFLETLNLEKISSILAAIERFCLKWGAVEDPDRDFIRKQDAKYFFAIANHFKSLLRHESDPNP